MTFKEKLTKGDEVEVFLQLRTSFHVFEDHDKTEGRGGRSLRYVVDTRAEADELAVNLGVWDRPGDIQQVAEVEIVMGRVPTTSGYTGGKVVARFPLSALRESSDPASVARLAAQARAKLTPDEARALGL